MQELSTFGVLPHKNFPFSSLLPIYLFYLSSCLYSLISFLTVFSQFFPPPFLFSSFLLLCHSAFYRVLSLLHLAPLKVYASAAAWHLWVERRQCPLQDSRTIESEASNKWIGSNSLSLRLQQQDSGTACLENSSSPECSFPCFGNFCCHSCSFSGLTLGSLFPEFYGNFCVFDYHTALKTPRLPQKLWEKLRITVLNAKILFASSFKFYTSSVHLSRKQTSEMRLLQ